ncbi:APC family permease [Zhenpiania hominis]|uniref:APC family permease n=1 Tax=Zhenpiania hominis TaxID=2763644 RepID=A0A923SVR1_9FIRM|nr:APC family permease [Zhenpiania hominis]MBC6679603.1 APC family permease [Zhenpiania hominis]
MSQNQTQAHTHGVAGLKKHDIRVSGIVFMLYCLVAAGAFGIEEMIPEAGPGMTLILLIAFPIVWAYPISNLVAELGSVLPSEGGVYVWAKEAFGEFWGFQAGWWGTVSTYITNGVYVALVAGYVTQMIPMSEVAVHALKIGMILIFTVINLMGLKEVGRVSTILSILIVLAFALVTVVGLLNWQTNPMDPIMPEGYSIVDGIGGGICICVWMYCGYECISNMAGEVKNPQVIPKGLMIAMPLVALTYVLPTLAGLASLPEGSWENWTTDGGFSGDTIGYATVLTANLGQAWGYIFLVIAIVSQCAIFNTYLASGSRGFFVLADDNLCPKFLVKVSRKRGVPYVGILSLSVVTLILAQSDFTTLVSAEVVFMLALYMILPLSVIKLRKTIPVEERKARGLYVMRGGKAGLVFYAGAPIVIAIIALLVNGTDYLCMGLIAISTGPIAYIIFKRLYGGMAKNDPERYPVNKKTKLAMGDTIRIGVYLIIAGAFAFLGQFWLHWYEITWGEWEPSDYDMFSNSIPQVLEALKWGGLIAIVIGIVLALAGRKLERKENRLQN